MHHERPPERKDVTDSCTLLVDSVKDAQKVSPKNASREATTSTNELTLTVVSDKLFLDLAFECLACETPVFVVCLQVFEGITENLEVAGMEKIS